MNRFTASWRNGDPVTKISANGHVLALGVARVWTAKSTGRRTVKVAVRSPRPSGEWEWPDDWVLGQGATRGACLACEQPFCTNDAQPSGFCPVCDREFAQEVAADSGIRRPGAYLHGARTLRTNTHPHTRDELDAIAAQQAADEKESLF